MNGTGQQQRCPYAVGWPGYIARLAAAVAVSHVAVAATVWTFRLPTLAGFALAAVASYWAADSVHRSAAPHRTHRADTVRAWRDGVEQRCACGRIRMLGPGWRGVWFDPHDTA